MGSRFTRVTRDQAGWSQTMILAIELTQHTRAEDFAATRRVLNDPGLVQWGGAGAILARLAELVAYAVERHGGDPDAWLEQVGRDFRERHRRTLAGEISPPFIVHDPEAPV